MCTQRGAGNRPHVPSWIGGTGLQQKNVFIDVRDNYFSLEFRQIISQT